MMERMLYYVGSWGEALRTPPFFDTPALSPLQVGSSVLSRVLARLKQHGAAEPRPADPQSVAAAAASSSRVVVGLDSPDDAALVRCGGRMIDDAALARRGCSLTGQGLRGEFGPPPGISPIA